MNGEDHSYEKMLAEVREGRQLTEIEAAEICSLLRDRSGCADPYTLLHILGKGDERGATELILQFVEFGKDDPEDDGLVRRIALQILADWWCLEEVFEIAAQMAFSDPSPFVRAVAASAIGRLGHAHHRLRSSAAALLLRGVKDRAEECPEVWESFYDGMLELAGVPPAKRPYRSGGLTPEDVDPGILSRIEGMVIQ